MLNYGELLSWDFFWNKILAIESILNGQFYVFKLVSPQKKNLTAFSCLRKTTKNSL